MALSEIRKQLGMPSSFAVDIWPMNPPLLVIADHELAERISKVSKQYPYSVPKSPTVWALHHIIGPESILMAEVRTRAPWLVTSPSVEAHLPSPERALEVASEALQPGIRPAASHDPPPVHSG